MFDEWKFCMTGETSHGCGGGEDSSSSSLYYYYYYYYYCYYCFVFFS